VGLFSLKNKTLAGVLTAVYSYLIGKYTEDGVRFFLELNSGRMIGNRHKLEHGKVIRYKDKIFTMKVVKRWCRLPRWLWNLPPWRCLRLNWTCASTT